MQRYKQAQSYQQEQLSKPRGHSEFLSQRHSNYDSNSIDSDFQEHSHYMVRPKSFTIKDIRKKDKKIHASIQKYQKKIDLKNEIKKNLQFQQKTIRDQKILFERKREIQRKEDIIQREAIKQMRIKTMLVEKEKERKEKVKLKQKFEIEKKELTDMMN